MTREELIERVISLVQGNPGALTVTVELCQAKGPDLALPFLEASGLRGPDLWSAYKDVSGQDLEVLWKHMQTPEELCDLVRGGGGR